MQNDLPRRRVLVGTVGYHLLRDYSVGPHLLPRLRAMDWPPGVEVDELNWGPVAVVQHFETLSQPYDRVVILTATDLGKVAGTITLRRWRGGLPDLLAIQDRVAEAVTGTISVYNLLVIGEYFHIWPAEVLLVDVQPGEEEAGDEFTPAVAVVIPAVLALVRQAASALMETLPVSEEIRGDAPLERIESV
jgi:hydrogenase maturation protease